jgi:hypothetical protein
VSGEWVRGMSGEWVGGMSGELVGTEWGKWRVSEAWCMMQFHHWSVFTDLFTSEINLFSPGAIMTCDATTKRMCTGLAVRSSCKVCNLFVINNFFIPKALVHKPFVRVSTRGFLNRKSIKQSSGTFLFYWNQYHFFVIIYF